MEYPFFQEERRLGILQATKVGNDTVFCVDATAPPGLYRVYVEGSAGRIFLGVWEGAAPLRRRFSHTLTAPLGTPLCGRAESSLSGTDGWRDAADGDVPHWNTAGGLVCRRGQTLELALPFDTEAPFPLPTLFCLARIRRLRGREWAVFRFTETGQPLPVK